MKTAATSFFLLALCSLLFTACSNVCTEPTAFRASTGPALYENEAYKWINTCNGPIELCHALITAGVITEEQLTAYSSQIGSLCIGGKLCMRDCIVTGQSNLGDTARIYCSELQGPVCVDDELYAKDTYFKCNVTVNGDVTATCCEFSGTLTATAEIINLCKCCTKTIYVCPSGPYYDPQVIYLKHGTVINGDIHFPSCRGKIVMDNTCEIRGQIYGGNVIAPFDCYEDLLPCW